MPFGSLAGSGASFIFEGRDKPTDAVILVGRDGVFVIVLPYRYDGSGPDLAPEPSEA